VEVKVQGSSRRWICDNSRASFCYVSRRLL